MEKMKKKKFDILKNFNFFSNGDNQAFLFTLKKNIKCILKIN
jgi:hypothetical protein